MSLKVCRKPEARYDLSSEQHTNGRQLPPLQWHCSMWGTVRAITMETPSTPQATEAGRACSLFHCVLQEGKWLINLGSSYRKEASS